MLKIYKRAADTAPVTNRENNNKDSRLRFVISYRSLTDKYQHISSEEISISACIRVNWGFGVSIRLLGTHPIMMSSKKLKINKKHMASLVVH